MSKALRKAIMVRSKLKNKYNKNRTENWDSYKKQRNFCVNLLKKTKKDYFNDLNIKNITDNKAFWKTIKPYFPNKGLNSSSLILSEKNKIVTNDQGIANIMNNYFTGITSHLNLKPDQINHSENLTIIENFKNHESIQRIKLANFDHRQTFNFRYVSVKEVKKELMNLSSKKATRKGDIPAKILKDSLSLYTKELTTISNNCLKDGLFPNELKLADVSPVFKKNDDLNKENYGPVSILSHMSKVFERIFYKQIDCFMTSKFSPFLCGFRKNHNSQYPLLKMIEVWKKNLDKGNEIAVVLMDLSKAFDTINHSLLLAKLEAYGFSMTSLKLMQSYLCNRFQRTSVNASFSDWKEIETGVAKGSILGPLLFNIFL